MALSSSRSSDPDRYRLQQVLVLLGIVAVATFWHVASGDRQIYGGGGGGGGGGAKGSNSTGFDSVNAADEEDFVTSTRTAITAVKLPEQVSFGKPEMDPNKPNLILHVGPVKAGVEALAREIVVSQPQLKDAMQKDNYVVAVPPQVDPKTDDIQPYGTPVDTSALHFTCQNELNEVRRQWEHSKKNRKHTLEEYIARVPCWNKFTNQLQVFQKTKTNVVIADEQLAQKLVMEAVAVDGEPAILDWLTLRETVMNEWNVIVVITYRRYYEWLIAAKARAEQVHLEQHSAQPPRLARWPNYENGMLLEPLFPHFVQNAVQKLDVPYTHRIRQLYQPFVTEVRLLNLHDDWSSMVTSFLCDVLPSATTACTTSQQLMDNRELATNNQLLDVRADNQWLEWQLIDELVNEAARRMYIRWRYCTRTAATITTEWYVREHLRLSRARDLPLRCPEPPAAQRFLDESLQYEQHLLPAFATVAEHGQQHRQQFSDWAESTKQMCSINMRQVLNKAEWRAFFRHLNNKSAEKIRAGEHKPGTPNRFLRG